MDTQTSWRRCSNCKNEIGLGSKYWLCSVASCTKVRAPVQFCSPDCWAVHEEIAFHKNAWAVEHLAPRTPEAKAADVPVVKATATTAPPAAARPATSTATSTAASAAASSGSSTGSAGGEVLVVVSRLKDWLREASGGMSTSDQVVPLLSDHVRRMADLSIASARANSRKTVLDRDLARLPSTPDLKGEVLVVVSKLKEYVRAQSDLRTSDELPGAISEEIRRLCLFAIESARKDGRRTVMGRDVAK